MRRAEDASMGPLPEATVQDTTTLWEVQQAGHLAPFGPPKISATSRGQCAKRTRALKIALPPRMQECWRVVCFLHLQSTKEVAWPNLPSCSIQPYNVP